MFESFYEMTATPFTRGIPSHELYMPPELDEVCGGAPAFRCPDR